MSNIALPARDVHQSGEDIAAQIAMLKRRAKTIAAEHKAATDAVVRARLNVRLTYVECAIVGLKRQRRRGAQASAAPGDL